MDSMNGFGVTNSNLLKIIGATTSYFVLGIFNGLRREHVERSWREVGDKPWLALAFKYGGTKNSGAAHDWLLEASEVTNQNKWPRLYRLRTT